MSHMGSFLFLDDTNVKPRKKNNQDKLLEIRNKIINGERVRQNLIKLLLLIKQYPGLKNTINDLVKNNHITIEQLKKAKDVLKSLTNSKIKKRLNKLKKPKLRKIHVR